MSKFVKIKKDEIDTESDQSHLLEKAHSRHSSSSNHFIHHTVPVSPHRESTPKRLLREFLRDSQTNYKIGIPSQECKPADLYAVMREFKQEWDLEAADMTNKEVKVQYMCYSDNLSNTIGA